MAHVVSFCHETSMVLWILDKMFLPDPDYSVLNRTNVWSHNGYVPSPVNNGRFLLLYSYRGILAVSVPPIELY